MMMMACVGGACGKHTPAQTQVKYNPPPLPVMNADGTVSPLQLYGNTEPAPVRFGAGAEVPRGLLPVVYSSASQGTGASIKLTPTGELNFFGSTLA